MSRVLLLCISLAAMSSALDGCAPPSTQPPAPHVPSPEVHADRSVTFRFRAVQAKEVALALEGSQPLPMNKEAQGVWSVTTPPLEPDLYGYSFVSDGVSAADPSNPLLKPNLLATQSIVHVPGPGSLPWEVASVPHGVIHHHFYESAIAGDARDYYVYTPPGYDASAAQTYPVLYLLHGFSDDASAWTAVGRAHVVVDNLIARGVAKPMIVVMPLGYGARQILAGGFSGFGKDRALMQANFDRFRESLVVEVLPRVASSYRTAGDRDSRAIAGLSMGGSESLLTGLNDLNTFAWVGAFSAGGITDDFDAEFPHLGEGSNLRLLWIACGVDDHLIDINRKLRAWLRSRRIGHVEVETPGGHTWMVWRRNLAEFAGRIFW
jgi:enterochelin esterase-like enzyme